MENQYIGDFQCFLCHRAAKLKPVTDVAYHFVDCPNCGQYKLSHFAVVSNAYNSKNRHFVAGKVFEGYYYKNEIKLLTADEFAKAVSVSTSTKLFNLAKYFFTETEKSETDIIQRPSCCYSDGDEQYGGLMNELKRLNVIAYIDATDDDEDFTSHFIEIHLTVGAKIKFENGINTPDEFMGAFMDNNSRINKISVNINDSTNSQINVAADSSTIKTEQCINPDIKEIIKLLDDLIPQIPNDVSPEIKYQIEDSISVIKSELKNQKPNKNIIKTLLIGIKGLVTTADFLASIATILDFLNKI
jgi:ribosomal protein L32